MITHIQPKKQGKKKNGGVEGDEKNLKKGVGKQYREGIFIK